MAIMQNLIQIKLLQYPLLNVDEPSKIHNKIVEVSTFLGKPFENKTNVNQQYE